MGAASRRRCSRARRHRPTPLDERVLLAVASGAAWLGVAYTGRVLGQTTRHAEGLALALPVAAIITLPFGLTHISHIDAHVSESD